MRILIAGEDAGTRGLLHGMLTELGHVIVGEVQSGAALIELAALSRPELIVLDLEATGIDVARVAPHLSEQQRAAMVAVSGGGRSALALARLGIGAVVHKPISPHSLAVAVEVAAARFTDLQDLRRQTEEAQRERVRLLQLFAASADGIYIVRRDGVMSMVNDAARRLLGMSQAGMRGRRLSDWVSDLNARTETGRPLLEAQLPLSRALAGEVVTEFEFWIDALDGATRCLNLSAAPVMDGEGQVVEAVTVIHDVTVEREREREIDRRAERRRRELTLLSTELLGAASTEDLAQRCVGRVRAALGAERVRLITVGGDGKKRLLLGEMGVPLPTRGTTMPPTVFGLPAFVMQVGETVRVGDLLKEHRFVADLGDGQDRSAVGAPLLVGDRLLGTLLCTSSAVGFFDEDDAHLVTLMANQAAMALENLRLSEGLVVEQKMAALGVMAAGLVHEIKNPLSYVQSNIESALELLDHISETGGAPGSIDMKRVNEDRAALAEAKGGTSRAFKIIDDIKTYAHPGRAQRELCDINRLVEVPLTLAANELRRWCRVQRDFARLPLVSCDGAKISQVVLNLLVNAAQAIERTARMGRVDVSTRLEDGMVRIAVTDDGPGMIPEIRAKIFDPFFTTKPAGVGTGLGLPISRRLMESQGGTIEVQSTPGEGTCFTVVFPFSDSLD